MSTVLLGSLLRLWSSTVIPSISAFAAVSQQMWVRILIRLRSDGCKTCSSNSSSLLLSSILELSKSRSLAARSRWLCLSKSHHDSWRSLFSRIRMFGATFQTRVANAPTMEIEYWDIRLGDYSQTVKGARTWNFRGRHKCTLDVTVMACRSQRTRCFSAPIMGRTRGRATRWGPLKTDIDRRFQVYARTAHGEANSGLLCAWDLSMECFLSPSTACALRGWTRQGVLDYPGADRGRCVPCRYTQSQFCVWSNALLR